MSWLQKVRKLMVAGSNRDEPSLKCPVCRTALTPVRAGASGRVLLDACPTCDGIWFDAGELDQLDGSPWANVEEADFRDASPDHDQPFCPRCRRLLQPVSPLDDPALTIDRCKQCRGFWLDRGELERMQQLAAVIDRTPSPLGSTERPPGWSDLRWRMHLLRLEIIHKG